jgi:hypothetical protein
VFLKKQQGVLHMKYSRLDFLEPAFLALNKHFAHGLSRFKEKYAASHYDPSVYKLYISQTNQRPSNKLGQQAAHLLLDVKSK